MAGPEMLRMVPARWVGVWQRCGPYASEWEWPERARSRLAAALIRARWVKA